MRPLATSVPGREQANLRVNLAAKDSGGETPDLGPGIRLPVDIDNQMVQELVTDAESLRERGTPNGAHQDS